MRTLKYTLPLLLSVGILLAPSRPGKWKMNHDKSKYTKGDAPKDEAMAIPDQGDQSACDDYRYRRRRHTHRDQLHYPGQRGLGTDAAGRFVQRGVDQARER